MTTPRLDGLLPARCVTNPAAVAMLAIFLLLLVVAQSGCSPIWRRIREGERSFALKRAHNEIRRGDCEAGLLLLDRAQAALEIGSFARESTAARSRCYEKLGQPELASAHRRLLADYYATELIAVPESDGSTVFRVPNIKPDDYDPPPAWLQIESPRYSGYARRSKIVGRVVLSFDLSKNGRPRRIRVLEMPHPLLATWAIEAIALAESRSKEFSVVASEAHYLMVFDFEWRWAKKEEDPGEDS